MIGLVKTISDEYITRAKEAKLNFTFGSSDPISFGENRQMNQVVYGFVDVNFMREILDNLIENAIKYTPSGGSIYVNVRGDGDRVLINVTDTGIGISADDLGHIFQKFYRADNSDTRTIGGTGLGLYIVKQRAEAMGGRVWAESAFGEGSTFYVSLPRITADEYEKRMIVVRNQQIQQQAAPRPAVPPVAAPMPPNVPPIPSRSQPSASPTPAQNTIPTPVQPQPISPQPATALQAPPVTPVQSPPVSSPVSQPIQPQTNNNLNGVQ